jgi:paraquat-inducible protein A
MILSLFLFLAGLYLPIITVRKLWAHNVFSVLSGIISLWEEKYYILAIIVFVFSVIFPLFKLISLFVLWFVRLTENKRKRLLGYLEVLGKWSMLDVFVVAIIIVTIKLGVLASAKAEKGIYCFAASIILAMIITAMQNGLVQRREEVL